MEELRKEAEEPPGLVKSRCELAEMAKLNFPIFRIHLICGFREKG